MCSEIEIYANNVFYFQILDFIESGINDSIFIGIYDWDAICITQSLIDFGKLCALTITSYCNLNIEIGIFKNFKQVIISFRLWCICL